MAFNGSGVYSRLYSWVTDRNNTIKIRADRMDAEMDGFADGLTNAICRDGQSTVAANIPWNNKKITGLGDATAAADALNRQSGDARYLRNPSSGISTLTGLDAADTLSVYDDSANADKAIAWSDLSADLLAEWRAAGNVFATGARVLFQAAPPTGWTVETNSAYNNVGLRFTTGTPTTGGTVAFDTLFTSQTLTGTVGSDTPTISKMAVHSHQIDIPTYANESSTGQIAAAGGTLSTTVTRFTEDRGSGTAHNHSLTMDAFNCALKYASVNIGVKD